MTVWEVAHALGVQTKAQERRGLRHLPWCPEDQSIYGLDPLGRPFDGSDVWHELAHWLVSKPENRVHQGFGLGPGPDLPPNRADDGPKVCDSCESCASVLGIWMEGRFGGLDAALAHAKYHSWHQGFEDIDALDEAMAFLSESMEDPGIQRAIALLRAAELQTPEEGRP